MSCPPDVLTPLTWRRQAISFYLLAQAPTIHTLAILLSKASSSTTTSCGEAGNGVGKVFSCPEESNAPLHRLLNSPKVDPGGHVGVLAELASFILIYSNIKNMD